MSFIKQTLKNTASLVLAAGIITTAYAALSAVNPGDTLSSSSWNEVVSKLSNTDTNSSDLTTKSYVDSIVNASGGGSFSNCETKVQNPTTGNSTLTCSTGKSIRSHSATCNNARYVSGVGCGISSMGIDFLSGIGATGPNSQYYGYYSASILCCDD